MAPQPKSHMADVSVKMNAKIETSIFDLFKDLNNVNEERQTECIAQLVKYFSENSKDVRDEGGNLSPEVVYTLKRLILGLGSPKPDVLRAYFTALTCLLSSLPDISCDDVKLCVDKELSVSSSSVSSDKKELLIARTLAWGCLMRSGLFSNAEAEQQEAIFTDLLTCSKKKSYLPLAAYSFFVDIIPTLDSSMFSSVVWPVLKNEIMKPWEEQSLDSLLLLLVCVKHHKNTIKTKYLRQNLGSEAILTEETLQHFAHRLMFSTYLKHPLFSVFSEHLSEPNKAHLLEKFWGEEIPNLLATVKNKDLATLELFCIMVESVGPSHQILLILSDKVVNFLNHALSDSYKRLFPEIQDCARKAVVQLGSVLTNPEAPDEVRFSVLKKLLFKSTHLEYEKTSLNLEKSTHVITILIGLLDSENAKELAEMFKAALLNGPQKNKKDVIFAVQQFSRLVYHSNIEDMYWRVEQLKFLIRQSFFKSKNSALPDDVASTLKQSFFKALGTKLPSLENLLDVLNNLVKFVEELLDSGATLRAPLNAESMASWKKMLTLVKKKSDCKPGSVQQVFHLLFVYMGLYLFLDAPMAVDALKELHSCYEHSSSKKRKSKSADEPHWIEVTVELLLSLLSHGSNVLRTVVGIVFTHLRKHITVEALHQILEVLHPGESENALSIVDDTNGVSVESDGEESAESDDSDGNDENEDDQSDVSSIEDDENSDLEDELMDEEETVTDHLRSEIRNALGNDASDNESVDIDEADEDELRRVDEVLVKAFQSAQVKRQNQKGKKKKKQSKVDELLMHFRLRVLDLLDIFLAKTPPFSLILPMIHPLLSLLELSSTDVHSKSLANRVRSLLHKISSLKKFPSLEGVTQADIGELLTALLNKGNRTAAVFLETVDVVTDCCTLLVRCSEHLPTTKDDNASEIINICKGSLESFLTKRDCLLPVGLFRSILTLQWEGCWVLGDMLVKGAFDNGLRPIRRTHSIELLCGLFKNSRLMKLDITTEKNYLKNISSELISSAVNLFENTDSSTHLQQKFVVSLCQTLQLSLSHQKPSPKEATRLSNALNKFSEGNLLHGEAKKRFNELQRVLGCKNKMAGNSRKKDKLQSEKHIEKNGIELNGHDEVNDVDITTNNGALREESFQSIKMKKKKKGKDVDNETRNKRQRKNSLTDGDGGTVKKVAKVRHSESGEDSIPNKKSKIVNTNGVDNDVSKPGLFKSQGADKKKKKKARGVK